MRKVYLIFNSNDKEMIENSHNTSIPIIKSDLVKVGDKPYFTRVDKRRKRKKIKKSFENYIKRKSFETNVKQTNGMSPYWLYTLWLMSEMCKKSVKSPKENDF